MQFVADEITKGPVFFSETRCTVWNSV